MWRSDRGKIIDVVISSTGGNWARVTTTVSMHSGCKFNMAAVRGLTRLRTRQFLRGRCVSTSKIPRNARGVSQGEMRILTSQHGLFRKVIFSSSKFARIALL